MINLLPPDLKQSYRYARRNRRLAFWILALSVAIGGIAIFTASGLVAMNNSIKKQKAETAEIQNRLQGQDLAGTEKEVTAVSNNLKLMVNVLSKQVLFSKLLVQLGSITPPNVALTNLSVSQTAGAMDITARSTNYNAAAQLQANLADPENKIFSKADIVNINCSAASSPEAGAFAAYPCTITIKALFASNNPFLFINTNKKAAP